MKEEMSLVIFTSEGVEEREGAEEEEGWEG